MPRKPRAIPVDWLIAEIEQKLAHLANNRNQYVARRVVIDCSDILIHVKDLCYSVVLEKGFTTDSARTRILEYFLKYPKMAIDGIEIECAAAISEYARRIRELRVEHGYQIVSGLSSDEDSDIHLSSDQYMLVCVEPDVEAAKRWVFAKKVKGVKGGSRSKIKRYLFEYVGKPISTEELAYIAGTRGFARRIRELRTEDGPT
jgi:hypothetical protein